MMVKEASLPLPDSNRPDNHIHSQVFSDIDSGQISMNNTYESTLESKRIHSSPFKATLSQHTLFGVLNPDGGPQKQFALSNNIQDLNCNPEELLKELLDVLPIDTDCDNSEFKDHSTFIQSDIECKVTNDTKLPIQKLEISNHSLTENDFYQLKYLRLLHDIFEEFKDLNGHDGLIAFISSLNRLFPSMEKQSCYYLVYQCSGEVARLQKLLSEMIPLIIKDLDEPKNIHWIINSIQRLFNKRLWNNELDNSLIALDIQNIPSIRKDVIFGDDSLYLYKRRKWLSLNKMIQ